MTAYDVVICGAGVSGLLLAAELSKTLRVVVLEKGSRAQCSNKFWLTSDRCLPAADELRTCVDSEWSSMAFIASNRDNFTAVGKYLLWDTKLLEDHLANQIKKNGSVILYNHRFYAYKYAQDSIISFANNSAFSSAILIDAMGYSSPIVSSANAVNILGYYHLFGKTLKLRKHIDPVAADNVILSNKPSFLEVFPRSDGHAHVVLIKSARTTDSVAQLENDFFFLTEKSHYADYFCSPVDGQMLHGIVPIGERRIAALDRIIFFGEAGQVHPAASCTCLNKIFSQYKDVARSVAARVSSRKLASRDLEKIVVYMNKFSQRFHINMFRMMSGWSSAQGESFIQLLSCLDQKSLDDLIFGEITPTHFLQLKNLSKVFKTRNTIWVKPLLMSLLHI